jgi:O-antigen ligase
MFFLSYFEEYQLGSIKIGIIWKSIVLAFIVIYLITHSPRRISAHFIFGTLYFFKTLVYVYHSLGYFFIDFSEALKLYILPASFEASSRYQRNFKFRSDFLKFLVLWTSFSCIPFFFGLHPLEAKENHSLAIYGDADGSEFAGVFANKHLAAVTLACSLIILFHYFRRNILPKAMVIFCSLICLIGLYQTYVRTGFLALMVGLAVYVFKSFSVKKSIIIIVAVLLISAIFSLVAMEMSPVFVMRMTGTNLYQDEASADQIGSGRFDFWEQALNGPFSEGYSGFLMGVGLEHTKDYMESIIGLRIFSHNGFLDAYQTNGILGFVIFILYFVFLFKFICKKCNSNYKPLALALYFQMLIVQLVQGGVFFWYYIMFSVTIGLCTNNEEKNYI